MDDYIENNKISIHFHGIEMSGLNDTHQITSFNQNQEVSEVMTKSGIPLRVYIQRGQKGTALVTFHDIGTNNYSFLNFFNCPEMLVILDNFTVYNVCAPGHYSQESKNFGSSQSTDEKFRLLSPGMSGEDNDGDIFTVAKDQKQQLSLATYPTMDVLAEMVDSVAEHFQLKFFLGMGVGAGANVMARYGMLYPNKLLGLFLINPDDTTTGYYQWTKARWSALPSLKSGVVTNWMENYLLDHWFGSTSERNLGIQEYYLQMLQEMNYPSTAGYIESYMNRTALAMVRPLNDFDKSARTINVDTCLITGDFATDLTDAMVNMNGNMNPSITQFLSIPDCSGMVLEEAPEKVANVFLNFLRNIGIMVTMTTEKLQKAAVECQITKTRGLSDAETMFISHELTDRC